MVRSRGPAAAAVVVVARRQDVRDDAVEHVQAVVGAHPLRGDVVVDDVAFVQDERDVSGGVLGDDPGGLRVEVLSGKFEA